ncbi:hypothetical protein DFQ28_005251 [Apophysomyces sp. BC1034]|nr:hypothetical protein DFQ30_003419 [Apophysomyces sp. BC1015]KAG0193434.1 hypothetical protein DFQ28_005251 [Apophysomyces sp. BC1034]
MSVSVADIFEDYVESLQNLPAEVDQNMHELRRMDEDFQRFRELYTKHRRHYVKHLRTSPSASSMNLVASRLQLEKDYKSAVHKQEQKIELALRMYDLVSRHIERIDSQMAKNGAADSYWNQKKTSWDDPDSPMSSWRGEGNFKLDIA